MTTSFGWTEFILARFELARFELARFLEPESEENLLFYQNSFARVFLKSEKKLLTLDFSVWLKKSFKSRVVLKSLNFLLWTKALQFRFFSFDSAGQKSHFRLTTFLRLILKTNGKIYNSQKVNGKITKEQNSFKFMSYFSRVG